MPNITLMSLSAENSYIDIGKDMTRRLFTGMIVSDVMQDIYSAILANAVHIDSAMKIYRKQWERIILELERKAAFEDLLPALRTAASELSEIPVRRRISDTPIVLLTGEIFVRNDDLSRQFLVEKLADNGFAVKVAGLVEWVYYTDWCFLRGLGRERENLSKRVALLLRAHAMRRYERIIKKIFAESNLYAYKLEAVDPIIRNIGHLINPQLIGEAILTVGTSLHEVLDHYCGVIAIGPFGCMPNRIAEAVLTREMNREGKAATGPKGAARMSQYHDIQELPFLAIESDGNAFPLIIMAKLESFMLQSGRIHSEMQKCSTSG